MLGLFLRGIRKTQNSFPDLHPHQRDIKSGVTDLCSSLSWVLHPTRECNTRIVKSRNTIHCHDLKRLWVAVGEGARCVQVLGMDDGTSGVNGTVVELSCLARL